MLKTVFSKTTLVISLLLNLALAVLVVGVWFYKALDGCAETANGRLGRLKEDVSVGSFEGGKKLFHLPKGLVVRDASASGMDWFESHRFKIVVTSDREDLIDFSVPNSDGKKEKQGSEFYSADKH